MEYIITLALGFILLLLAVYLFIKTRIFLKNSERAYGEVVELKTIYRNGSTAPVYKPIFLFTTAQGTQIKHESMTGSYPASWKIGEKATYAYLPSVPHKGRVLTFFGTYGWPFALACLSLPMIIIGIGY